MEIKNLKEAAKRIKKAIENGEKIILYGDADLDGVTSVLILKETIESLGGKITKIYFPDREIEGYGISEKALENFKDLAPALFIALDCGIGNFNEVKKAKKMGFEVIIVDHHEILDNLPEADIIVDPKQPGDSYPFKEFATVGLAFKLSEAILENKMNDFLRRNFLELVAIATIADMMVQEGENKEMIREGLISLASTFRPGFLVFFQDPEFKDLPILKKVGKMISILNVRDVQNHFPASFRLLGATSLEEAQEIISNLKGKLRERKEKIERMSQKILERISENDKLIFEGDENFDLTLLSSVASFLCQKFQKPVFLYKKMQSESHGTVRTPKSINGVELLKKCKDLLISYGGHPQAAGFRIKNENLDKFKNLLLKNL
jgi:single-stranded-DNA-specific exonuclease